MAKRKTPVAPKVLETKLPWKKWTKVPMAIIGALATLFVTLQGIAWVDGRHDQKSDVLFLTAEVKVIDEKVKSTAKRLDYIDLIQAVSVRDRICDLADKDRNLKQECVKASTSVEQIRDRIK